MSNMLKLAYLERSSLIMFAILFQATAILK